MGTHPIFESDFDCLTEAMKRPGLKAGSKRQNIRLREKIKKKVAEHKRKERRDAKKSPGQGKTKKQHVPNSAPFKDEVMSEAIAHEERKNAVKTAKKLAAKERKEQRKAGTMNELIKGVQRSQAEFDKKQVARDEVKMEAYETDAEVEGEGKMEQEDDMEVEAPATKKVRFEPTQKKTVDASDLRKVQKVAKDKMKRKDKFETKLSANFEKALGNL